MKKIYTLTVLMKDSEIKQIFSGKNFSIILMYNGDLFGFGSNVTGELGVGHTKQVLTPTFILNQPNIKKICCGKK